MSNYLFFHSDVGELYPNSRNFLHRKRLLKMSVIHILLLHHYTTNSDTYRPATLEGSFKVSPNAKKMSSSCECGQKSNILSFIKGAVCEN